MVLEELGQKYELAVADRAKNAQKSAAYLKITPNGRIAVLVDGELVLFEATATVLHLVD
jgi:glutathione S-transferase